jgi:hypothetical protein
MGKTVDGIHLRQDRIKYGRTCEGGNDLSGFIQVLSLYCSPSYTNIDFVSLDLVSYCWFIFITDRPN